ncbi:hypothetical protein B0H19DRAFT_1273844 [Mycena capillaripes]|nr:hypothetical protein B0H19DRAFT_1273844 [Mycena capillaripes]
MDPLQLGRVHRASPFSLSNWLNAQLHTGGVISKGVDLWTDATDEAFPRPRRPRSDNHRLDMLIYDLRWLGYFKITAIHSCASLSALSCLVPSILLVSPCVFGRRVHALIALIGRLAGPAANILILGDVEERAIYDKLARGSAAGSNIASSFDKVCEHPSYFSFLRFPAPAFDVGLYEARGWSTTRLGRARMGFPRGCAGNARRADT